MSMATTESSPAAMTASAGSRGRIIMVEDDQEIRESIAEYLSVVGFDVTAVGTGIKFYQALAEQSFQLAVIDIGLPDMSGLQLAEYLRNNTAIRCIILTARDAVEDRVAGYDVGADIYMVKPVDCRELAAAISCILQRSANGRDGAKAPWRLNLQNITLVTPSGSVIPLTVRESDLLRALAVVPEVVVPRPVILLALGYRDDDYSCRALESLIRRLRRKIEQVHGSSPILTRHGVGYSFSAPLIVG